MSGGKEIKNSGFFKRVYDFLLTVPPGKVVTYGDVAAALGAPRMARQVGYALHANPAPGVIPCHRVVNRFGALAFSFAFGGAAAQAELLKSEGVEVKEDFTVELSRYRFNGAD